MASEQKKQNDRPAGEKKKEASAGGVNMNRRIFLGTVGAISGTALLGRSTQALASAEFEGYPNSFGVLTDLTLCVGCRSCEKACNEANGLPEPDKPFEDGSVFEESRRTTHQAYTVVNRYENPNDKDKPIYRKVQCNHCKEPACLTSCPIHAYSKTPEGAVQYNPDLCFGCRYCMTSCPFNIPAYDYWSALEPRIHKCTMCLPRIQAGGMTACAEACPTGALTFGKREELLKIARKRIADNPGKYVDHIYGEKEVGGTNWMYISGVPFEQVGLPTNLPNKPLIEETKGFLSAVPIVLTAWPALFGTIYAALRHRDEADEEEKNTGKNEEVTK
jgi:Fe-S-cluster-containing dehydrogenase component